MSTNNAASVALTAGWTNTNCTASPVTEYNLNAFNNAGYGYVYHNYWYPYYRPLTTLTVYPDHRPIRLSMDEVERLRVAAKKDKDLKATLEKFTEHIEVIVDFGKAA